VVALTLAALLSVSARRFCASLAAALLVFCLLTVVILSTRGFGNPAFESATDNDVTVLTWNTLGDAPGPGVIAQLAIDTGAEVIALPETTYETGTEIARILDEAGKPMWLYTVPYDQISKARSTTLLISVELGEYDVDVTARTTSTLPSVVAHPQDGTGPTIIAVHAVAPIPGEMENWRNDLQWLKGACAGGNVIMAGDFNSTVDHYSGLATADGAAIGQCFDAGIATDNGAVGTWPTPLPGLVGAPIDHVMVTPNWRVSGMRVVESHDKHGSDHRPVLVQLTPTG
jgi:endonuclease/exonuclease/phosphatase (EEP) superfamily protein YafD